MKSIFSHLFFITGEIILLGIQYSRAEIFAFDVLPELADADILGIYGSHLFAVVWLFIVLLFTYLFWELFLLVRRNNNFKLGLGVVGVLNMAVMVAEGAFFYKLVENDTTGFLGILIGVLLVAGHQVCSFWITENVFDGKFFSKHK